MNTAPRLTHDTDLDPSRGLFIGLILSLALWGLIALAYVGIRALVLVL